jgi:hypothetical protein
LTRITIVFFLILTFAGNSLSQVLEVKIHNTTGLPDSLVYVAVVGEDLSGPPGKFVWLNLQTGIQVPMNVNQNTIIGPSYGGDLGPGQNSKYANCFFKLSELNNGSFNLPPIQGCRIFITQEEQLYLYFFDQINVFGYAAPNKQNPNDPNNGILYEIIELTYNQYGFFGNTTRVDAYHRPIGMELIGNNGTYRQAVGEVLAHKRIIERFLSYAPEAFQNCFNPIDSTIAQPSKIPDFQAGGAQEYYFKSYVDQIWTKYKTTNLTFITGDKGVWSGRVNDQNVLELTCIDGPQIFKNRVARISAPPNTQEVIEGKGVLNQPNGDTEVDLAIQAQICAAINRHAIDVTSTHPGIQDWSIPSNYYKEEPANFYAGFWHQEGISISNLSYGFAYDDVWEQSSSLHATQPEKLIIYFGDPASCLSLNRNNFLSPEKSNNYPIQNSEDSLLEYFDFKTYKNKGCPIQSTDQFHYIGKKNYNEINLNADILIYPNPLTSELNTIITLKHQTTLNLYITNLNGNMVKVLENFMGVEPGDINRNYAIADLKNGTYYLVLEDLKTNKKYTEKFIKY